MKAIKLIIILNLSLFISCDKSINPNDSYSWTLQRVKQDEITYYSIFFWDQNNGWICGNGGILKILLMEEITGNLNKAA